jgi:hypothetical protein
MTYQQRLRRVALIKAVVAAAFLLIVAFTLRHPVSLIVSLADLGLIPFFVWLARRHPRAATYGLVLETALALTPRQFVQGYVNGVNWPIYIVLPLIAGYVLREGRAALVSAALVALIAVPAMLLAALALPAGATRADVLSLAAFVIGLMLATALVARDLSQRD